MKRNRRPLSDLEIWQCICGYFLFCGLAVAFLILCRVIGLL